MNSVEQAIRAAISKGNEQDQDFRRKIYGSASAALERSLTARPFTSLEVSHRRESFLATVRLIESEFVLAIEPEVDEGLKQPFSAFDDLRGEQVSTTPAPALGDSPYPVSDYAPLQTGRRKVKSAKPNLRWLGPKMAINIAFLVVVAIGGFWAYKEGTRIYDEASSSEPPSVKPVLAESGSIDPTETIEWIQVFTSNDTELLTSSGNANAEITSNDGNQYVAMSGDSTNEVAVKIGAGLLKAFAGKRVLFNFKARSANGKSVETGVRCQLGTETKCERKRFKVDADTSEFMFAVNVSPNTENEGALLIAPDLTGGGGIVEIESIRATLVVPGDG